MRGESMKLDSLRRDPARDCITGAEVDDGFVLLVTETETWAAWVHVPREEDRVPLIIVPQNGATNQIGICSLGHHAVTGNHHTGFTVGKFEESLRVPVATLDVIDSLWQLRQWLCDSEWITDE